jgi:hypothetical protein
MWLEREMALGERRVVVVGEDVIGYCGDVRSGIRLGH